MTFVMLWGLGRELKNTNLVLKKVVVYFDRLTKIYKFT